ncbi:MAG: succinate dehydrogenase, cytochrome b556 subunit [Nitrospiraceae bacterium]|nr:succinate dehydrogenase, cytochrome b556 subunit [Nitrospiraceae bacterium]
MRYRLQTGSFAWVIHRLTGISLTLYIFLHLYVLSSLRDPAHYEALMKTMRTPLLRLLDAGLLGLVLGHGFNGFRLTLIDMGISTKLQKPLFWVAFVVGALLFILGALPIAGVVP